MSTESKPLAPIAWASLYIAPPWVIIYEEIHEDEYIPEWTTCVKFIKCFIDDGCGVWDPAVEISEE